MLPTLIHRCSLLYVTSGGRSSVLLPPVTSPKLCDGLGGREVDPYIGVGYGSESACADE